ncbi:MAG: cation transporter [Gemmatimonadota bacterium]
MALAGLAAYPSALCRIRVFNHRNMKRLLSIIAALLVAGCNVGSEAGSTADTDGVRSAFGAESGVVSDSSAGTGDSVHFVARTDMTADVEILSGHPDSIGRPCVIRIRELPGTIVPPHTLKADALDFVGDGLITVLGLVAIRRSASWRARTALIQGGFLALLGLGVLANTTYRTFVHQMPSSEAMGVLAALALIVNLAAATLLLPHRTGDSNVRAVWLFSRNDALGNLLVLVAAGLVALTGTPWPDVLVGAGVAALFLQSSLVIIRSAQRDLLEETT